MRPETPFDWSADAHAARLYRDPLRARRLLHATGITLIILIIWAALARIDEVTRGEDKVVPSRQLQVIQSLDGGLVSEIRVREGQIVEAGDVLVRLDATRFESTLRENRAQRLALIAKTARLAAITEGIPFVLPPEVVAEAPDIAANEQSLYDASQAELEGQVSIANKQLIQREQELREVAARYRQTSRNLELATEELDKTEPLVDSGAVSEVEILRLKRDVSRLGGERDQAAAQTVRANAAIEEARRNVAQVELDYRNVKRNELADATAILNSLSEGSLGLSDRVKQADVRSPMRGTIKRLLVNTEGGVLLPGRDVAEIVPLDDTLLLEARIAPRDIAFLRPGQSAMVRITAYDFVVYGGLEAKLESIGADTITDEQGNAFYLVRIRTNTPSLGPDLPVIPGMVAEVDIRTGRKSVLAYLMKPVLRARQVALTER
ncbi:MAG: HlyD family type I secretion periplasmic adaptor subunit [Gammaproteobacteria bacterium]